MPRVQLLIADPDACVVERPNITWIVWGSRNRDIETLADRRSDSQAWEGEFCRLVGDSSIVKVTSADGAPRQLDTWKGLSSANEIFYTRRPDGELLVADHFRNMLSLLPPAERSPTQAAIVDHFLFRSVPGENSYCREVRRVGYGEKMTLELDSGDTTTSLFDRVEGAVKGESIDKDIADLDQALASVLEPMREDDRVASLFSGGVDSTLIQSYFGPSVPALNLIPTTLEMTYDFQAQYAAQAARLLKLEPQYLVFDEADYAVKLDETVAEMGLPPGTTEMPMLREAFALDYHTFVSGERADALFGTGRIARIACLLSSPLGLYLLNWVDRFRPDSARERWQLLLPMARSFSEDLRSPDGFAAKTTLGGFLHYPLVERIFGRQLVRERLLARLDYAMRRVVSAAPQSSTFLQHLEAMQWADFFCEDTVQDQRHLAHSHGKSFCAPFLAGEIVNRAIEMPLTYRYIKGFQGKFVLKRLLQERLPGYAAGQRKGTTNVPFERFYADGPLSDIWERYPVPDFIEGEARRLLLADTGLATRNAVTYAIWDSKVCRNAALTPVVNSRTLKWGDPS